MRDVTPLFVSFREAARHLWNSTFYEPGVDWDRRDSFSRVLTELFTAVVLDPLGETDQRMPQLWERAPEPLKGVAVHPNAVTGVPIAINRASPRTGYWDDPVDRILPEEARMEFVQFFDWDELGPRDLKFVEVRIADFPKHPALAGRYALIEFSYARFLFTENEQPSNL
jgi:hypothetical protein